MGLKEDIENERKKLGISSLDSNASDLNSIIEMERKKYNHADENKQYSDLMKSAHESNPASFHLPAIQPPVNEHHSLWNGIKDNPITNTAIKALDVAGKAYDAVSHLPVVNQVTGAMQGLVKPFVPSEEAESNQPLWKKYLGNVRDGYNLTKVVRNPAAIAAIAFPKNKSLKDIGNTLLEAPVSAVKGALHPDEARKSLSDSLENKSLVTQLAVGSAADPLSYVPIPSIKGVKNATSRLSETLNNFFGKVKPLETETVMKPGPILGLPEPKSTILAREAQNRSVLPTNETPIYGPGEIYKPEPLGLPEGNYTTPTKLKINNQDQTLDYVLKKIKPQVETKANILHENTAEASAQLDNVNSQVSQLESAYQNEIKSNYEYLKNSMDQRTGVSQGSLIKDAGGEVISRVGRISNNPKWYQDFYRENGRTPTNKDLMELAKKHVEEGHVGDNGLIPSWTKENNYHDTLQSLYQVRDELGKSLNDQLERGVYDIAIQTAKDQGYDLDSLLRNEGGTFGELAARMEKNKAYGVYPESSVNIAKPNFNVQHVSNAAMPESKVKVLQKDPNVSYGPQGMKKDGLTIMEKYFPDGKVDTAILNKLPYEERIQFQKEQTPKNPNIGFDPNSQALENLSATPPSKPDKVNVNNNQAADNVKNTAEPRIKEKVVDYFDEAEKTAAERLRAKKGSESTILPDEIKDRSILLASQMARKNMEFSKWYGQMIDEFGEGSKELLPQIWGQAEKLINQAELRAKVIVHVPGVNQGVDSLGGNKESIAQLESAIENSFGWKNKGRWFFNRETAERNFEDIMGADAPIMKKTYIEPIQKSAADRQRFITQERNDIKDLGIKYNSPEDALVQKYGEGEMSELELMKVSPDHWQKIKKAAEVMRAKYDNYLDTANAILEQNGYDAIPKRKNYFPHYEEIDGLLNKLGFGLEDNTLNAELNGLTANLKPGKNFFNHALRRTAKETTLGALAGHDRYIEGISKLIYQTNNIKRLRGLDKYLRKTHEGTTHLSDFLGNLTDYTNIIAGKKSELDRSLEAGIGRNLYSAVDAVKRKVGLNMIGGSVSSAITNSIPITQMVAATSKASVLEGLADTVKNIKGNDEISRNSDFLTRRFTSDKLAMGKKDKVVKVVMTPFKAIDHFTSNFVVRSKYSENINKGMSPKDALHSADQYATRMMADRSEGSMPTLFHSRTAGLITQFQLEVNNQVSHLFKDLPRSMDKKKYASVITQTFIYSYLYNELSEKLTGNRPAFDPIGIVAHAIQDYTNDSVSNGKASTNLVKNIAGSLPFASVLTGGRIPLTAAIPNPITPFLQDDLKSGLKSAGSELMKPVKYLTLPVGGSQINKTLTGLTNLGFNPFYSKESGVYGKSNGKDVLKYPVERSPSNIARGLVFGKNAFPETDDFYKDSSRQLSTKQTEQYESLSGNDKKAYYDQLMRQRKIESLKVAYKKATENENLSLSQKQKQVDSLTKKYNELVQAN